MDNAADTSRSRVAICVAGWHFHEALFRRLATLGAAEVFVVSHRPRSRIPAFVWQCVRADHVFIEPNRGYDWGCYQQFLEKGLWRAFDCILFLHDDVTVLGPDLLAAVMSLFARGHSVVGNARVAPGPLPAGRWAQSYAHAVWKPPSPTFTHEVVRGSFFAATREALARLERFEVFWDPFRLSSGFGNWSTRASCARWTDRCGPRTFGFLSEGNRASPFLRELVRGGASETVPPEPGRLKRFLVRGITRLAAAYVTRLWEGGGNPWRALPLPAMRIAIRLVSGARDTPSTAAKVRPPQRRPARRTIKRFEGGRLVYYNRPADRRFWEAHWRRHPAPGTDAAAPGADLGRLEEPLTRHLPRRGRILEAGCGSATLVIALRARGYDVEGVDWAADPIRRLRERRPDLPLWVGDAARLPFPDAHYAAYISIGVVEHRREGPQALLKEAWRVLAPGGVALISVPYFNPLRYLKAHLGFYRCPRRGRDFYQYAFRRSQMTRWLRKAGFRVAEVFVYHGLKGMREEVPALGRALKWRRIGPWLECRLNAWRWAERRLGHMILFVCRKPGASAAVAAEPQGRDALAARAAASGKG